MRNILIIILIVLVATNVYAWGNSGWFPGGVSTVTEADGSPTVNPTTIKFSNGTVTDNGDGTVSVSSGSGSGSWTTSGNDQYSSNSGNVGVGSASPVAKLDVGGVVKASTFQTSSTDAGTVQWFEAAANGSNYINWSSPSSLSTDLNWTWPSATGTAGQILMRDTGSGTNWSNLTAVGNITGSGTANKVTKWTSTTAIGDSVLTEISSNIGIGSASPRTTLDVNGGAYFAGTGGNIGIGSTNPGVGLDVGSGVGVRFVGIGTTVPQQLCRKADGTIGYFNGAWASTCN